MDVVTEGFICGLSLFQLVSSGADEGSVRVSYVKDGDGARDNTDAKRL